jgi:Zn-dependent peptidase ImmA (M78 family)
VRGLSAETLDELLGSGKDNWSGGAASHKLPNGQKLIILNPTHGKNRHNATLMEEVCHVFLGHKPSRLAVENRDRHGKVIARDYNADIEEEAYSTGAAALVPYSSLKRFVERGKTSAQIARHFNVSRALVEYRIKISRLWDTYKDNIFRAG